MKHLAGGNSLPTETLLVSGNSYYATQTVGGMESCSRFKVTVTITNPATPTGDPTQAFCNSGFIALLKATGSNIRWYAGASGGSALSGSTVLINGSHYYGSQTLNGCESASRLDVQVMINNTPTPAPTGSISQTLCSSATLADLVITGQNIKWYSSTSSSSTLAPTTQLLGGISYYASQTINGCESSTRLRVNFTTNTTSAPVLSGTDVLTATDVSAGYNYALGIMQDGTLWGWGKNGGGQLGDGTINDSPIPIQISPDTDWKAVEASGEHSLALKTDGSLWAWGDNGGGQLGIGSTVDKQVPTRVGTDTNWKSLSSGSSHTLALKQDGTLWAWGWNYYGQVGNGGGPGASGNSLSPVKIGNDTDWVSVAAGGVQSLALKADGTLWIWGKIGKGTHDGTRIPTVFLPGTKWRSVAAGDAHVLAIRTDGTLWVWGSNEYGQLGDGWIFDHRTDPFQIGTDTNWELITGGFPHSIATKADGTVWAWGDQNYGELGVGPTPPNAYYTPVQVTAVSDFIKITASGYSSFALRRDGTIWTWGQNYSGQMGSGSTAHKYVPSPLLSPIQKFCNNATVADLSVTGIGIRWYDHANGGSPLAASTSLVSGNYYYATQTQNGLESCSRLKIQALTNQNEAPPGPVSQVFCQNATVANLVPGGPKINWYEAASVAHHWPPQHHW
jgi:alpha-tubulin suppressor-like RCC1 family protein